VSETTATTTAQAAASPAVHAAGGLAERLQRLLETTGPAAQPADVAEALSGADADARERDDALAAGMLELRGQVGASRVAIGELPSALGDRIGAVTGALASRLDSLDGAVRSALAVARGDAERLRAEIGAVHEEVAGVRADVASLRDGFAELQNGIEERLGARLDDGIFALAQTVLAARR